ncbi:interferon regulatory factor 10 [Gouania willdenowi]|uniref:Interferon regulatory factor 4-like n=1 Tax=Gouania willdenowi TaxID=441366 RepID=A0A8C5D9E9_GOUWI|nr:interferon regulatory factor 4-like [Gouania willdenowi]
MKMDEGEKLHLKEWLVAQVESGNYDGLSWEDEKKTMFRIPWKHAAKKDYKQTEDAAIFKAWAVYKGKYTEGRDKADPTTWKTRLRCALNKSSDFQEVPDRNQLDITEPYKVYRIQQEVTGRAAEIFQTKDVVVHLPAKSSPTRQNSLKNKSLYQEKQEEKSSIGDPINEHLYCELIEKKHKSQNITHQTIFSPSFPISDFRMEVILFYHGQMVRKATTQSPDGCFILQGQVPLGNERIYGPCTAQLLSFPSPRSVALPAYMVEPMNCLLHHLERGVLIWVAPDGVFIKRFCQGRVYWNGPLARHHDRPNKLEREKTLKLLDTPAFVTALQSSLQRNRPTPSYEIELCFGEEYPDPSVPKSKKLIMAKVVPLFAVEMLEKFNLGETGDTACEETEVRSEEETK